MIRTLIFGAIAGYVGKKLYDEGKLTEFKQDLVGRYHQARDDFSNRTGSSNSSLSGMSPTTSHHTTSSSPIAN